MAEGPGLLDHEGEAARYRTLLEINNALIANLSRDTLFRAIAQALHRVVPFERTAIFLHDRAGDVLRLFVLESAIQSSYFVVGLEMPAGESHVGWVFQNRQALVRHDLATERQYPLEDRAYADGIRSFVLVPLVARDRCLGVLAVASTVTGRYAQADARFLQEVANQVALAVDNMTAYEEIAALKAQLEHENVYLQEEISREYDFVEMVGTSPALLAVLQRVTQVASTDATVLVCGETGTGKELIARAIHHRSTRRERALVKVNCSAISAGLVESELFGHVKGAFTGALERRVGRFELAHRGTIFLDEIGDLPLETQVKLLRVLQEREFEPVGSNRTIRVDVRVIAATNRDLAEAVRTGRFRADLYYRLNVFPIDVPALRERRSDVPQLATFFMSRYAKKFGKRVDVVPDWTMRCLADYAWPGNVRELQNVVERAMILSPGPTLDLDPGLLPALASGPAAPAPTPTPPGLDEIPAQGLSAALEAVERNQILAALERSDWVIEGPKGAAVLLKLHPNTLRSRLERLGIKRPAHDNR